MNTSAGSLYQESGKVEPLNFIVAFILSIVLSALLGIAYGSLSHLNPLIYINFLILAGAVVGIIFITTMAITLSKTRNKTLSYLLLIVSSLVLIYNAWGATLGMEAMRYGIWDAFFFRVSFTEIMDFAAKQNMSIGKIGRSGLPLNSGIMFLFYIVEFFAVLFFPILVFSKASFYFCEACQIQMEQHDLFYTRDNHIAFSNIAQGNIEELNNETIIGVEKNLNAYPPAKKVTKIGLHNCVKCGDTIVDIELGETKHDDKKRSEFKLTSKEDTVKGLYIDAKSRDIFFKKKDSIDG